ncbi:MAG TPA: UDP-N-acetylglucosamine 2-epimerase [Microvirga sp.]|jgi:UDP-hydrolysing UDP-N-acetyl-D-glucosamine 2-epimerase|nr:UDP-N-acetylglucosamine 2-epimerase [Microvirga sp.]
MVSEHKRKVCVVITARPSYSRVRTLLRALEQRSDVQLQVVAASGALLDRYGNVTNVIEADGHKIDAKVYSLVEGETLLTSAKSTGLAIVELASVFDALRPDIVVTIADRYETLGTAVAASYTNIPLAHIQGGEVTGSIDEKVRHAVCKLADLHFPSTRLAAERIARLGEDPHTIHWTGCPSVDIAAEVGATAGTAFDPFTEYGGVGANIDVSRDFLVVMQHPVTTEFSDAGQQITETLEAIRTLGMQTFWFWPNVDAGSDAVSKMIRVYRERGWLPNVHFFRNLRPEDFLRLMLKSRCIIGNSSVTIREGSYLGVPAVNIGTRQQYRERGPNVIDVDYDRRSIESAVRRQCEHGHYQKSDLYGAGNAGERMAEVLATASLGYRKVLAYVHEEAQSLPQAAE